MRTSTTIVEECPAVDVAARPTGLGRAVVAASTVSGVFLLSNAVTPLYASWQAAWGFDTGLLTVVFATYMVGLIVTLVVDGRLADRFGHRTVLIPGIGAAVAASALFLTAQDVAMLLVGRLLTGVAVGAVVTAGMAAVVDLAPSGRKRTGSLVASAAMVLGAGVGPVLAGAIATLAPAAPQIPVFAVALVIELLALLAAASLPQRRPVDPEPFVLRWPMPGPGHRRELVAGVATFAPGLAATSFVLSLGPTVLRVSLGTTSTLTAGVIACAMFLAATGIQFALAGLGTRVQLACSSIAAIVAMAALTATVTVLPSMALLVVAALLAGVAQGLGQLAGLSLIAATVPADRRAESNAALNIGAYLPAGVLSVLTGYAAAALGLPAAVTAFAVVVAGAAALALLRTLRSGTTARA